MEADRDLTDDQRAVLEKVEKLLRLADQQANSNPAEAASAAAKAQELLLVHNLSADLVGNGEEASGKRADEKVRGGFYEYQCDLWNAVAELNFCFHFVSGQWVRKRVRRRDPYTWDYINSVEDSWERAHRLVGRVHNIAATKAMARYLEAAVERLVEERIKGQNNLRFSRFAVSYREGAVSNIIERIYEKRKEMLREEARKEAEALKRAEEAGRKGVSTETAVTIASLTQSERDANVDFMMGEPGYSARQRAERAAQAAAAKAAQEEYTRWAAAHPEEAAAEEKMRREEAEKTAKRRRGRARINSGSSSKEYDINAYYAGRDAGEKIGLDPQTGGTKTAGALG